MDIEEIRRDALSLWLRSVRIPLTIAEAGLKRGQDTTGWGPTLAFEKAEAAIKSFVGTLVHDHTLVASANLQRAEVVHRQEALAKRADAAGTRADVRRQAKADEERLEAERQHAEEAAAQRTQRLEDDRRRADQNVTKTAARKRAATRQQAAARADASDKAATKAEAVRLRKEADALRAKERAVQAQGEALQLDRKVQAKKAARKAG